MRMRFSHQKPAFVDKMLHEYEAGHVAQAIVLSNDQTGVKWAHRLMDAAVVMCFTKGKCWPGWGSIRATSMPRSKTLAISSRPWTTGASRPVCPA